MTMKMMRMNSIYLKLLREAETAAGPLLNYYYYYYYY
jgi:hypothetical protein